MTVNLGFFSNVVVGTDIQISGASQCETIVLANRTLVDCIIYVGNNASNGQFAGYLPGQVTDRFDIGGMQGWSGNLTIHPLGGASTPGISPSGIYAIGYQQGDVVAGQYPSYNGNQVQQVSATVIDIGSIELISNTVTPLFYSYLILNHIPINSEPPSSAYIKLQQDGAAGSGVVDLLIHNATGSMTIDTNTSMLIQSQTAMTLQSSTSNINAIAAGNLNLQSSGSNGAKFDLNGLFSFLNANNNVTLRGIKTVAGLAGASPINYTHGLGVTPQFVLAVCTNAAQPFTVGWNNTIVSLNFGGAPTFSLMIFY